MSSPSAQVGPTAPKDRKVLGKVFSRMKTVLKRERGKPGSAPSAPSAPSVPRTAAPNTVKQAGPEAAKIPRTQVHEERARKLGAKFGLEIQPNEWHSTEGHALRVEKPIRMRIHRTCHECKNTFGSAKECPKCKHSRCSKCPRYPPRRTDAEKEASRDRMSALAKKQQEEALLVPDYNPVSNSKKMVLTRPSKTGGQDLVHRKPRQRVRRNCHECGFLFATRSKICEKCSHIRCTDCPRDPPKKNKYPLGYPGDEFGPKSIPHFTCHECNSLFPRDTAADAECRKCKHSKCEQCTRAKPRRVEPGPDPEVLKSLQAKIAKLGLS